MTVTILDAIKYVYSSALLVFSVVIVMALIANEETTLSQDVHPALAYVVIWGCLVWLNMVEGGQGALVGLPPVDRDLYANTHPTTAKCTTLCHKGDNLDRYLIGRQFMVLMIVFMTNLAGAPLAGAQVFGLPEVVIQIFLGSGVAMILMTTMAGQLNSQVNASHCMLDYINNYFARFTLYVALAIEFSGLLHAVYLVQLLFAWASGKPLDAQEGPRTTAQSIFFWGRIIMSLAILCFAFAVTISALFNGQTTMWEAVPNGLAIVLFFVFMSIVGMLEGMQIAFFAVARLPKSKQGDHPMARKTCELLFRGQGRNLPGFMIGRQISVTMCFFIIARVTTLNVEVGVGENIFGVSDGVQRFFNTGLLGALITTIVGSISWQLVASAFPIAFLSNPLVYAFLRICLFLEATGICSGAWVLAAIHKKIAGFQCDEVYIGTPEDRAASQKPDSEMERNFHMGTNVLPAKIPAEWLENLVIPQQSFTERRQLILANIKDLREQIGFAETTEERQCFEKGLQMEIASLAKLNEEEEHHSVLITSNDIESQMSQMKDDDDSFTEYHDDSSGSSSSQQAKPLPTSSALDDTETTGTP